MAKERSKLQRWVDSFTRALFLDENGKPKSATFLYAFLLALLFVAVYIAAYLFLLDPLHEAFSGIPTFLQNVLQYLVPALIGSVPCVLLIFLFRGENKRLVPCAYLFLAIMLVLIMLAELLLIDWSDAKTEYTLFWMLLGLPLLLSVVCGGVPAFLLWCHIRNKQKKEQAKAPNRPSYYNT
jgi:hypothetical protein